MLVYGPGAVSGYWRCPVCWCRALELCPGIGGVLFVCVRPWNCVRVLEVSCLLVYGPGTVSGYWRCPVCWCTALELCPGIGGVLFVGVQSRRVTVGAQLRLLTVSLGG